MKCSIRIMGDKELAFELAELIKDTLSQNKYNFNSSVYSVFKDKKTRNIIDENRIRIYISVTK